MKIYIIKVIQKGSATALANREIAASRLSYDGGILRRSIWFYHRSRNGAYLKVT